MNVPDRPLPTPDPATAPYWAAAREHRLAMPHCLECGHYHFYPRTLCPQCNSPRLEWSDCTGRGVVYSFTVIHRAPSPAFAAVVPYVVATIKLEEGPHLMTNITGCAPDTVRVDMPVRVTFIEASDEITLPMFEPVAAGA